MYKTIRVLYTLYFEQFYFQAKKQYISITEVFILLDFTSLISIVHFRVKLIVSYLRSYLLSDINDP